MSKQTSIERQFVREIRAIPDEYLPNLLQIVRLYRDSVALKELRSVSARAGETRCGEKPYRSLNYGKA